MPKIILASASPRRADLLKQIGIDFRILPSNINENLDANMVPEEFASSLSREKALSVAQTVSGSADRGALVIGADTIVVKDGILGKPSDRDEALSMLKSLQGEWHYVITGISVVDSATLKYTSSFELTKVKMRKLTDEELLAYINTGEPMDKAGAYGIQGLGALLVEKIEGCYFNVVGLPLTRLSMMLENYGVKIL